MNPVIGQCPICHDTLHVTRLHCRTCDTAIEGHFTLGRLYQLSPQQLQFIEIFIKSFYFMIQFVVVLICQWEEAKNS